MTEFATLPALQKLGDLSKIRPVIVTDTREQDPLRFQRLESVLGTLTSGDYSILGCEESFAIERKSIPDLVSCITTGRDRLVRELHRLRGLQFSRLLIVGNQQDVEEHNYRSQVSPKAVMHSLASWEAQYIPVVWSPTPETAAALVEKWAFWYARSVVEAANSILRAHQSLDRVSSEAGSDGAAGKPELVATHRPAGKADLGAFKARVRESARTYNEKIHGAAQ
jgi:DNA excision repair protein ERCC-4